MISRLGRSQESAAFVYLREKKVFQPTTLHWLRIPGQLAQTNAELAVLREINDLNQRFDAFAEWSIWQAMGGSLVYDYQDVQASIDYKFPASHLITAAHPWSVQTGVTPAGALLNQVTTDLSAGTVSHATPVQIVEAVRSWKRIVQIHGRVPATEAFATSVTMAALMEAWVSATTGATVNIPATMLSDRMKDEYYASGMLSGFMGMNWTTVEQVYEDDSGNIHFYVPDGNVYMGNYTDQRPLELMIGPTADDEAPDGFTGKYAKTWKEKDPSARQYLLEWSLLPIVTRPEQLLAITGLCTSAA